LNTDVTAAFNENMNASTIVAAAFTLSDGSGNITGTVSYGASTRMATFKPASPLAGSTVFTATLASTCQDTAGNGLAADYTWSFTTGGAWSSGGGQVGPVSAESEDPTMLVVNGSPAVGYREASFQANLNVWDGSSWGTSVTDPTGKNMNYTGYHAPSYCSDETSVYVAYSFAGVSGGTDDAFYDRVYARQWVSGNTWLTPMNNGEEISVKNTSPPGANAHEPAIDCDASGNVRVAWIEDDVAGSVDDDHLWVAIVTNTNSTRSSPLSRNNTTGSYGTDVISVDVATDGSGSVYVAQWENHHNDQHRSDLYVTRYGGGVFTNLGGPIADDYDRSFLSKPSIAFIGNDLYIAYSRTNNTDYTQHVYVQKYESGIWVVVGSMPVSAYSETDHYYSNHPDLLEVGSDLYIAWEESDQYEGPFIYVAKLSASGADWEIVGDKLNVDPSRDALNPSLGYDTAGQALYIAFEEMVSGWPQIFVKKINLAP